MYCFEEIGGFCNSIFAYSLLINVNLVWGTYVRGGGGGGVHETLGYVFPRSHVQCTVYSHVTSLTG